MAGPDTLAAAEGTVALGWFDDESFLVTTDTGGLLMVDAASGIATEASLARRRRPGVPADNGR